MLKLPEFKSDEFHCPHCGVYAHQEWKALYYGTNTSPFYTEGRMLNFDLAICFRCHNYSIWFNYKMIFPATSSAPLPHPDLPEDIRPIYEEARDILARSPKGAAALLRLALQKLCIHLGGKGKDLNEDIGELVKKGLSVEIQKALDIVRVVGNNAVHPGVIDLDDTPEIANRLFQLINIIVERMITQPKQIEELYSELPESAKNQIDERDGNK
ncbi:MAG: DUF4145 domain-containing protein [Deltaproteobacteria bacterium]|nr:DUF4145 domain-containing protein [Deltaproteobacteria bacterium]